MLPEAKQVHHQAAKAQSRMVMARLCALVSLW
jgi:hypothetical protein